MRSMVRVCAALMWMLSGCGGDDNAAQGPLSTVALDAAALAGNSDASPMPGTGGGALGAGAPLGGGMAGATPAGGTTGAQPAGGGALPGAGAGPVADAGTPNEGGAPPVLQLPGSSVDCGGTPCNTLTNVCCGSWSASTGFGSQQSCITRDACNQLYSRGGESNRVVAHTCDGAEDCGAGQVCCFMTDGRPICDLADILICFEKITGPGGGRICAEESKCKLGSAEFIGEGAPLGVLSCNDDGDCRARAGTSCQPERDNTLTTGRSISARSDVKVCQ